MSTFEAAEVKSHCNHSLRSILLHALIAAGSFTICASTLAAAAEGTGAVNAPPNSASATSSTSSQASTSSAGLTSSTANNPKPVDSSGKAARSSWDFDVLLDESPIGNHRFTVTREGQKTQVKSLAEFDVKILGLSVFRYRHEAREQWNGDCLVSLQSKTDDDGTPEQVNAQADAGGGLSVKSVVKGTAREKSLPGCVMSFAYWNPVMLRQTTLLNAQTGKLTNVTIEPLPDGKVQVGSGVVEARRYRLTGGDHPLVLSYSPQGEWLALESTVSGGKHLRYQLPR